MRAGKWLKMKSSYREIFSKTLIIVLLIFGITSTIETNDFSEGIYWLVWILVIKALKIDDKIAGRG